MEDDNEVMLIWDFNVKKKTASLTAAQCLVNAKTPNCADKLPIMPLMDLKKVSCNCVDVKSKGKVVLESCEAASAADDLQKLSIATNYDDYQPPSNSTLQPTGSGPLGRLCQVGTVLLSFNLANFLFA